MRRAKWGVGAAAVVGLAWLLSNLFNIELGGIGSEDGASVGLPTSSAPSDPNDASSGSLTPPLQSEPVSAEDGAITLEGPEKVVGASGAIEVLVDGRDYSIRRGTGDDAEWIATDVAVISKYARQAQGDETGVRVRVFRRPSALSSAEEKLAEELRAAGLTTAEIDVPDQLLIEK